MRMLVAAPVAGEIESTVLARAQRGDAVACQTFVEQYQARVFALLSRLLPRRLVEDAAQETFLRSLAALKRFDASGTARLSTWVLTIATRLAIDELRRNRVTTASEVATLFVPATAETLVDRRALGRAIERAIMKLEPSFRAAFVLSAYHELSHEEIATALGIEVGTVKSRVSRAKAALREELDDAR